jgi:metallo-beta-lactamase family protein
MRISFYGAAGEVTGSCYLVETASSRVLLDFGVHQGSRDAEARNFKLPPIDPGRLACVVLTHAHNDHTGRLPLLFKHGFRGPIHCTHPTAKLSEIILKDSGEIQVAEAARETLRNERAGKPAVEPLYTPGDVEPVVGAMKPLELGQSRKITGDIAIRLTDAGHILGSASVEMTVEEGSGRKVVVFSGDLGPTDVPLLNDPTPPVTAGVTPDLIVLESTYGDRDHRPYGETVREFEEAVRGAMWEHQKVLIPAFSIGRTQLLLHHLGELRHSGRVPSFPVYVDSPMAEETTRLYGEFERTLDADARKMSAGGHSPLHLEFVRHISGSQESRELNDMRGGMVIIAGSGMATGGRIMHHLRHNLWKRDTRVIIVGFQAEGTLGRDLVEGRSMVRIFGDDIAVRAKIHTMNGFSAHAGQSTLLAWAGAFKGAKRFALTHGEEGPRRALAGKLRERLGAEAVLPVWGETVEV